MRIDSGITHQHAPDRPTVLDYYEPTPHRMWLTVLSIGIAFAAALSILDVVWNICVLGTRVRGHPSLQTIRACRPFVALGEIALQWVAVWLVTSDHPAPRRGGRLVANLLRFLVTILFLISSADVLRLYEGFGWRSRSNWAWLAGQSLDLTVTTCFWPYVAWLALQLDFPGMAWRAILAMLAAFTAWIVFIGPWMVYRFTGMQMLTDRYFQNLSYGVVVLCSTIELLVLLRFLILLRTEERRGRVTSPARSSPAESPS